MAAPQGERTSLLLPLNLTAPGAFGITEELSMAGEDTRWLFEAQNAVFTDQGLLAPRELFKQWNVGTSIAGIASNPFYPTYAGSGYFVAIGDKIVTPGGYDVLGAGFLLEDGLIASTRPTTTKHWKAVYMRNLNPAKSGWYLFASGEVPKYTDGSFFTMDMPDGPQHGIAHVAFGRIWTSDGRMLQWSQLLNGRDWTTAGTGELELQAYLTQNEIVTAIADFNNFLVVFTNRSTLIFDNPFNVGVDTAGAITATGTMSLKEKIDGTGCVGVNAWTSVGEELYFVSYAGLYRMSRIMADGGSNPMAAVVPQINRSLVSSMKEFAYTTQNMPQYRLNYHPLFGCMSLETGTEMWGVYMIWLTRPVGNNSFAVTQWGNWSKTALIGEDTGGTNAKNTKIQGLYSGSTFSGSPKGMVAIMIQTNNIGQAIGYAGAVTYGQPNARPSQNPVAETNGYTFRLKSTWLNFGDNPAGPQEKIPKDLKLIYRRPRSPYTANSPDWSGYVPTDLNAKFILRYDYDESNPKVHNFVAPVENNYDANGFKSFYPSDMMTTPVPLSGSGNLVQWELRAEITNLAHEAFAVQRAGFSSKLGRINQGI